MGLLDKAAQSHPADKPIGSVLHRSLLHKADDQIKKKTPVDEATSSEKWLTSQSFYAPPSIKGKKDSAPFITAEEKSVISKLSEIKEGVETPGQIYSLLKEELSIVKGAFLVQEPHSDIFLPWALTGYDKTTSHRLRIPRSVVLSKFSVEKPSCLYIESEDNKVFLRPFFSIREFGLLEKILLCPFIFEKEIIGFLLITDSHILNETEERSSSFVMSLVKVASPVLYRTREQKLANLPLFQPLVKTDIVSEVKDMYKSAQLKKKKLLLLVFSIQEAAQMIQRNAVEADLFRIKHDLSGILTAMLSDSGGVMVLNESDLLLIVTGKKIHDETLLVHQISLSLNDFTQEPLDVKSLIKAILKEPKNEKELIQFIENWI